MLFRDVVGKDGGVAFWQSDPTWLNNGVTCGLIVMSIDTLDAQKFASGVNTKCSVVATDVLMVDGLQVPLMPLLLIEGNAGAIEFWQSACICVNEGVVGLFTVILIVVAVAHWFPFGVNVYTTVPATPVLMLDGFQLPLMPLFDRVGKAGGVEPRQSACICVKLGPVRPVMVMLIEVPTAHVLPVGVNT